VSIMKFRAGPDSVGAKILYNIILYLLPLKTTILEMTYTNTSVCMGAYIVQIKGKKAI